MTAAAFLALLGDDLRVPFTCNGAAFSVALVPTKAAAYTLTVQHAGIALEGAPIAAFQVAPGRRSEG